MGNQRELILEKERHQAPPVMSKAQHSVRILMAAGGTGGHIFPALAVADELRQRSQIAGPIAVKYETVFLGSGRTLEARLIPSCGYRLETIQAAGLKGIAGWKRTRNVAKLPRSAFEAARLLYRLRPGVVLGIGGYVSGPVMLEAALARIPTLLYEPNAIPGFTNRVLAPVVRLAAVGFEEALAAYGAKGRLTGHPVRQGFYELTPKVHQHPYTIVVIGGSQGARALNQCVAESLPLFQSLGQQNLRFIHQTGEADYNAVRAVYGNEWAGSEVCAFIDNIAEAFSRADLIICRAGAATIAELAAAGKASILVPYPSATDQHQLHNARALERAGGANVIEQKDLNPDRLVRTVVDLLSNSSKLAGMEQGARSLSHRQAAARIADLIEELCGKHK